MNFKDIQNSKVITVLFALVVLFVGIGILYPWLTSSSIPAAKVPAAIEMETPPPETSPAVIDQSVPPSVTDPPKPQVTVTDGPVYYGIATADLEDDTAFPDGTQLYEAIRGLGNVSASGDRKVPVTSFTAPGYGYYVYFAWPTAYEENGTYSCKSITHLGVPHGSVDCFTSSSSPNSLFGTTDMVHRTVSGYVNEKGEEVSYELYRAHFVISPLNTVYYASD